MSDKPTWAIAVPTVHLNGTGREALERQYFEAAKATTKALQALREAAPNERDYYVQGSDAFKRARREHEDRVARMESVKEELYHLHDQIMDAGQ